jgi:hypothetical protein
MATNATWTVVMDDKIVINHNVKNENGFGTAYNISDNDFWGLAKWSNVWAIQYVADNEDHNDTVEYRDTTPHASWTDANLGSFQDQFITKWDAAHLAKLQADWDNDNLQIEDPEGEDPPVFRDETEAEKISRLGARPTSYSS